MKNVILIGMPGAGKSTVGVVLAKVLGYDFIDSDLLIQKEDGRLLWQIIRDEGIEGFNQIEERVNSNIQAENSVISTGGSVVYGPAAMEHLRSIGTVVFLDVPYPSLKKRLGNLTKRGVVLKPGQTLQDLYQERITLYRKYAHVIVRPIDFDIQETVAVVCRALDERNLVNPKEE
ncbi:MAG: shikimate kinase [Marvinbryantia sp.]|jgi:shikimate kinase